MRMLELKALHGSALLLGRVQPSTPAAMPDAACRPLCRGEPPLQVAALERAHKEAKDAARAGQKLLADPPPTDKLVLHVSGCVGQVSAGGFLFSHLCTCWFCMCCM